MIKPKIPIYKSKYKNEIMMAQSLLGRPIESKTNIHALFSIPLEAWKGEIPKYLFKQEEDGSWNYECLVLDPENFELILHLLRFVFNIIHINYEYSSRITWHSFVIPCIGGVYNLTRERGYLEYRLEYDSSQQLLTIYTSNIYKIKYIELEEEIDFDEETEEEEDDHEEEEIHICHIRRPRRPHFQVIITPPSPSLSEEEEEEESYSTDEEFDDYDDIITSVSV